MFEREIKSNKRNKPFRHFIMRQNDQTPTSSVWADSHRIRLQVDTWPAASDWLTAPVQVTSGASGLVLMPFEPRPGSSLRRHVDRRRKRSRGASPSAAAPPRRRLLSEPGTRPVRWRLVASVRFRYRLRVDVSTARFVTSAENTENQPGGRTFTAS